MHTRELELAWLVQKIRRDEDLIRRAEAYYQETYLIMSAGVAAYFQDMLERKKDQLYYEEHRAEKLGWLIACGREEPKLNI